MRRRRTVSVLAPRSNVHKHPVTLGESLEMMEKIQLSPGNHKERRENKQEYQEKNRLGTTRRKKGDSTQVARCL